MIGHGLERQKKSEIKYLGPKVGRTVKPLQTQLAWGQNISETFLTLKMQARPCVLK